MPTKLPPKTICLNCNYEVKTENKYCPNCGQENADKRISLKLLLKDSFETAFNFESRFFQTIPYFLFFPGKLTNEFLAGKRVRYMHPFKIYLLSSLLFFFVAIQLSTPKIEQLFQKIDNDLKNSGEIYVGNDSTESNGVDEKDFIDGFKEGVSGVPTQDSLMKDSISNQKILQIKEQQLVDSISKIIANAKTIKIDNINIDIDSLENLLEDSVALRKALLNLDEKSREGNNGLKRFLHLIQDRTTTPEALLDSLNMTAVGDNKKSTINIWFAQQLLKVGRNDPAIFLANIINNIGTLMFFTLPLLALFFIPFYLRRKKYYIDHLIFTLHIQAFTFVLLTLVAVFFYLNLGFVSILLSLALLFYVWFAFKKVYKQGFFKTSIKAVMISFLYFNTLVIMLSLNLLYSFLMF